jgi:glycosyltransferase involved in cell wall biosynthesis
MKVLIFMSQFYQLGGAERLQVELAEELNKRGIQADILSMYSEELPGVAEAKKGLLGRGIPNVNFLGMKVHPPLSSLIPTILKLRRLIREQKYDIVETSSIPPTVIAAWALLFGRTRHVSGLHQVFLRDRENSWQHKFWRFSIRCNRRIRYYAISDYVRNAWASYSKTPVRHTRTIYNAIPDEFFNVTHDRHGVRRELEIPDDARIILYVGRLAKYKGCDTLLAAMAPILEQDNLYLLFVGVLDPTIAGSEEMLDQMKNQSQIEAWGERVRFLGYRKDIPQLMATADVLAHPTTMEGFGLTLVEAMAVGLPIVTTNVEGIPEVLQGTDSIMVAPTDPQSLRGAVLSTLKRSPSEVTQASEKGRKRAEKFRLQSRTDMLIMFFNEIISKKVKP